MNGTAAVAHLDAMRKSRGITHLVVPEACGWWLREYPELSERIGKPVFSDADCSIYALAPQS